jgi:hypothetical protein
LVITRSAIETWTRKKKGESRGIFKNTKLTRKGSGTHQAKRRQEGKIPQA